MKIGSPELAIVNGAGASGVLSEVSVNEQALRSFVSADRPEQKFHQRASSLIALISHSTMETSRKRARHPLTALPAQPGMIPAFQLEGYEMRLAKASEVQALTGLSTDQLREWTTRRGIIAPDAKPNGPGSRARYSWQTVLLLRLAVVLKQTFHVELQSQRALFLALARNLGKMSFPALRGMLLVIGSDGYFEIHDQDAPLVHADDVLTLHLDPHLDVLSTSFGLAEPMRQLPLFPVRAVA